MEASLFKEYAPYLGMVIGQISERYNDENTSLEPTMLHKTMLDEEYSADLRWGSTTFNNSVVAADVVALDSSLPLKSRPSIENASGTLPKLGVKYKMGEQQLTDIQILESSANVTENQLVARIYNDVPRVIKGMDIRKEIMFRQALSSGVVLAVDGENTTGTGIRANFGYKTENTFSASNKWDGTSAKPITDLRKMTDAAIDRGDAINHIYIPREYFNYMRNSEEGKRLAAFGNGVTVTEGSILPIPSRSAFLEALKDEFGAEFHIVQGSFLVEKEDGSQQKIQPWEEGAIIGVASTKVGRLVYGTLAEENHPANNVTYSKSGTHVLISRYSKNEPSLEECTAGQAIVLPVIDGGSYIYKLNAKK